MGYYFKFGDCRVAGGSLPASCLTRHLYFPDIVLAMTAIWSLSKCRCGLTLII